MNFWHCIQSLLHYRAGAPVCIRSISVFLTKKTSTVYTEGVHCTSYLKPAHLLTDHFRDFLKILLSLLNFLFPLLKKIIIIQPSKDTLCARDTKHEPTGRTCPLWKTVIFPISVYVKCPTSLTSSCACGSFSFLPASSNLTKASRFFVSVCCACCQLLYVFTRSWKLAYVEYQVQV